MIEEILPGAVVSAESFGDLADAEPYPAERAAVAAAPPARRREFATTRACARRALGGLGLPAGPVPPGERGAPCWPAGVVGSMTHCAGYRAAAVARGTDVRALGIDAEPHGPLPGRVLRAITGDAERAALAGLAAALPGTHWDRLLFSAKEAVYKVWFPLTARSLGFRHVTVEFDPAGNGFAAGLRPPPPAPPFTRLTGRWLVRDGLILTALAIPAEPATTAGPG
ncbi:4'-phosphopantetheinyl transferase [Actinomadura viridis]|uniref:4'-phosphopantetheinyl transferase family protein n=1 Tax=Actinomadura viridis TaxID=58110 RepID=UPI003686AC90